MLIAQVAILVVTSAIGLIISSLSERRSVDYRFQQEALAVARTTASDPQLRAAMADIEAGRTDDGTVQAVAERIRTSSHISYVVVIGLDRIRHAHPIPSLIGERVEEPIVVLDGKAHTGFVTGPLGRSANARVPLYGPTGGLVGEVSVGVRAEQVAGELRDELALIGIYAGSALAVGAAAAVVLARRLKRSTYGLELEEIADLLKNREAMLYGIREGMTSFDPAGRLTAVNAEAQRLLSRDLVVGARLDEALPDGRLRRILEGTIEGTDFTLLTDDHCLVLSRMPVVLQGQELGTVVTVRDRTEVIGLVRELDAVRGLTDALRAQQHEFANRMHTLAGLLELGEYQAAMKFAVETAGAEPTLAESVRQRLSNALIVGLIVSKTTVAAERGVRIVLEPESELSDPPPHLRRLLTIVGNLLDNAVDAAVSVDPPEGGHEVRLLMLEGKDNVTIRVQDTGPGVPPDKAEAIFDDGWSTRPDRGTARRGLGLALVHRLVTSQHGSITVSRRIGAVFTVVLPLPDPDPSPRRR
jgi:two-component system CitB family sensor kinase